MEHAQGSNTTSLYPANTGVVSHGSEVRGGMVWHWEEGKAYSEVPAQILLGVMSCCDDLPPKRNKDELESLGACHEGERENTHTMVDKNAKVNKQTK